MNLFVYGTLLVPEIWEAVTAAPDLVSHPAELRGFLLRRVKNASYPGIVISPGETRSVPGRVVFEVSPEALRRLDAYEGGLYQRREVHPLVPGLGTISAHTYLIPPEEAERILSEDPWTLDWFENNGLGEFRDHIAAAD